MNDTIKYDGNFFYGWLTPPTVNIQQSRTLTETGLGVYGLVCGCLAKTRDEQYV